MLQTLRNHKRYLILIGIVILIAFARITTTHTQHSAQTYTPSTGSIQQTVTASGHISSAGTLDVYTTVNGVLTELYVQNGQTVEADTPLFKVTSTASPQEKATSKAAYLTAIDEYNAAEQNKLLYQAQLEQAREAVLGKADGLDDYLNRTTGQDDTDRDLAYSQDWSARKLFDNAEKKFVDATQTLQAKSQNITAKKTAYQATLDQTITSTVSGTIANINPQLGDEVALLTATKDEPVLTVSNFDTYAVHIDVGELDIYRIALGQSAMVHIESFSDKTFTGSVTKIDTIGTVDNGLVTYTVTVDLHETDIRMRAGMTAEIDIVTDSRDQALIIPHATLGENEEGKIVYVQTNDKPGYRIQPVEIGIKNDTHSEVLSGLTGNETLLDPLEITNETQP